MLHENLKNTNTHAHTYIHTHIHTYLHTRKHAQHLTLTIISLVVS